MPFSLSLAHIQNNTDELDKKLYCCFLAYPYCFICGKEGHLRSTLMKTFLIRIYPNLFDPWPPFQTKYIRYMCNNVFLKFYKVVNIILAPEGPFSCFPKSPYCSRVRIIPSIPSKPRDPL